MQLPYFYEENIHGHSTHYILSEPTSKHCIQVLRMQTGEQLQLTDGKGNLFTVSISQADKKNAGVDILQKKLIPPHEKKICIAISLLKNNSRFEWFLEKATEIGVHEIIPLLCSRTERPNFREDRMKNILIAAMLQSRQTWLPLLQSPTIFKQLKDEKIYAQKFIAHCANDAKQNLAHIKNISAAQILIGPEGDFTEDEIQSAIEKKFLPVSLGNTRLRTETAGIVAATFLMNN